MYEDKASADKSSINRTIDSNDFECCRIECIIDKRGMCKNIKNVPPATVLAHWCLEAMTVSGTKMLADYPSSVGSVCIGLVCPVHPTDV